ncbi:hypothetical protein Pla52o_16880 [Novipirellula galeiformis]|uniref:Uncharacterized protein n=1 Tax=Novipirellula galeiformis TaxID=2528004 RepID=A0A5C6CP48_9BACT|nr:hypothetical protein Pla52o_16880 [Novipirellula galeiformis]
MGRSHQMGQVSLLGKLGVAPERSDNETVADRLPFFVGGQEVRHTCGTKPPRRWFFRARELNGAIHQPAFADRSAKD